MSLFRQLLIANSQKKKRPYYCEVEYLEGTGTQYIDTGYKHVPATTRFEFSFAPTTISDNSFLFGARNNTSTGQYGMTTYKAGSKIRHDCAGIASHFTTVLEVDKKYIFTAHNNTVSLNEESYTGTITRSTERSEYNFALFTVNTAGTFDSRMFVGKIYYSKLWDDGVLIRDMIPVLDWDMRPCMYDKVSGEFLYNQGTGDDFLYGREIHQVEYLESTGTQYIDTGITQNSNIKAELSIYPTVINKFIFGSRISAGSDGFGIFMHSNNGGSWYPFFNAATTMIPGFVVNEKYDIEFSKYGFFVNKQLLEGPYTNVTVFTGTLNIYLFAMNSNGALDTRLFIGKIYSTKLYENDVPIRDLIPAVDENGVGFMFDRVSHTIFDNIGTGVFKYPAVELEYLETNGGPCIDTGIQPTDEYGYRIRNTYRYSGGEQCAIGAMDNDNRFVGVYTGGVQISGGWGSFVGYLKPSHKFNDDTIWDVYCNYKNDRQIIVNDELLKELTDIHIEGTITNTIYLFARHYGNNITKMYGRIYSTEITKGSDVVAYFIPCIKDGQLGMWDKVNEVFYPNNGTGTFIGGKIVESEEE